VSIFGDVLPAAFDAIVEIAGEDCTYSAQSGPSLNVRLVVSQPRADDGSVARFLRFEGRASDFAGAALARGDEITLGSSNYTVLDIDQDRDGWIRFTGEKQ
jgi:hypothetical protein